MNQHKKHDWNSWTNYLSVHEKTFGKYLKSRFISGPQQYAVKQITDQYYELSIQGLILRSDSGNEIQIKIEKTVEIDIEYARPRASTFGYSYHALTSKPHSRNLLRYCSPHEHRPHHHKHVYNLDGTSSVVDVMEGNWPHVSEFLDEVLSKY